MGVGQELSDDGGLGDDVVVVFDAGDKTALWSREGSEVQCHY